MKSRKQVIKFQKKLKDNPTQSEQIALEVLYNKGLLLGVDFLFQEIFGFYILDFVFPTKRLIIELDGWSHRETKEYDKLRDSYCEKHGLTTVRIPNSKCHLIFEYYSQYRKVSKLSWERLKQSAELEYFNKKLTYTRKPPQKRVRKKKK